MFWPVDCYFNDELVVNSIKWQKMQKMTTFTKSLRIVCFVRPALQNPKISNWLWYLKKKSSKHSHFRSWKQQMFDILYSSQLPEKNVGTVHFCKPQIHSMFLDHKYLFLSASYHTCRNLQCNMINVEKQQVGFRQQNY